LGKKVLVLVGTKRGAFILESNADRACWQVKGPFCQAWPILHFNGDPATGTLYAAGGNEWFGPAVWRSADLGATWTQSNQGFSYGDEGPTITKVWNVTPAHGALYAGVEPAGLFRSDDGGATWEHVGGLRDHPSRPNWMAGGGGLILHTIVPHPTDSNQMWLAMSAVGTFYTADGGKTWTPRNKGVRADFMPEKYPEFGQCVHRLVMASGQPNQLYQQNHCGVYRSADGGQTWEEITAGLPSEFGFPMAAHPRDPKTVYAIPLNGAIEGRYVPDAKAAVWRTNDGGDTWTRLSRGLPQENAYFGVLRGAMAVDPLDSAGVYFGTGNGQIYGSRDEGETWSLLAEFLPPVSSIEIVVVE
jgi:photosystem II stability/assembly factor-like uncharacterized protein